MDATPQVFPPEFAEKMQPEALEFLSSVMEAVNRAPDGDWIGGSEEQVRNLAAEFRERVFQQAIQGRIDAAEAAFSPSADDEVRSGDEAARAQASRQQGAATHDPVDHQWPDQPAANGADSDVR